MPRQNASLAPTPERVRQAGPDGIVEIPTDRAGITAYHVRNSDAFDGYYARGLLADTDDENAVRREAGVRLRQTWHESGLGPCLTGNWTPAVQSGRDPDLRMVRALASSQAYARMIRIVGPDCSWPVISCCCMGEPVGAGRNMDRLREGLRRLAVGLGL